MRRHLLPALASLEIGLGIPAVLLTAFAALYAFPELAEEVDAARTVFFGVGLVLGAGCLVLWWTGRRRHGPLLALAVVSAVLGVAMVLAGVLAVRPARFDLHFGLWAPVWSAAVAALCWAIILVAAAVELRLRRQSVDRDPRRLLTGVAIAVPLVLVTALAVALASLAGPAMIRINSRSSDPRPAAEPASAALSGKTAWSIELRAGDSPALPTEAGLAVPVGSDRDHNAGVILIDPATGETRWRYELKGIDSAPGLASTAAGNGIVVSVDGRDLPAVPSGPVVLDADTGRLTAVWPARGRLTGTDPPVVFDKEPRGTNSVTALAPSGRSLWTYRPQRCDDPHFATGTPTVILVDADSCDGGEQLIGLDARSGEPLWQQPSEDDLEYQQNLARESYQLELKGQRLERRQLDTGEIGWSTEVSESCDDDAPLVADDRTLYHQECRKSEDAAAVTGYAVEDGGREWRRDAGGDISSLASADHGRVLALVQHGRRCTLKLMSSSGSTTLQQLPEDVSPDTGEFRSGSVRCSGSRIHRVGDSFVLQAELASAPGGPLDESSRYRFIALA